MPRLGAIPLRVFGDAVNVKPFYSFGEVAELLSVHPDTVRRMVRRGELDTAIIGRTPHIPLASLQAMPHVWDSILAAHRWGWTGGSNGSQ